MVHLGERHTWAREESSLGLCAAAGSAFFWLAVLLFRGRGNPPAGLSPEPGTSCMWLSILCPLAASPASPAGCIAPCLAGRRKGEVEGKLEGGKEGRRGEREGGGLGEGGKKKEKEGGRQEGERGWKLKKQLRCGSKSSWTGFAKG